MKWQQFPDFYTSSYDWCLDDIYETFEDITPYGAKCFEKQAHEFAHDMVIMYGRRGRTSKRVEW